MSYEWIRRRKRYLGFRYLFPEIVAPWIQFKRALLRVLWFFTHPVDEFFETVGEIIVWPFVALATVCAWISAGVRNFFDDLFEGVATFFKSLGRLPVWTGAAIAGTLGIIMTIGLFLLQIATFTPVPLSTAAALQPRTGTPEQEPLWRPQPLLESRFDPFAGSEPASPSQEPVWQPTPVEQPPTRLQVEIQQLEFPGGWDSRQRIDVVSTATPGNGQASWTPFEQRGAMSGWSRTRLERAPQASNVTPYVLRRGVRSSQAAPNWVAAAASISEYLPMQNRREPEVGITRTAPMSAQLGGALRYELIVSNRGIEPLDSVLVREAVSAIDRVMEVDPPADVVDDTLVWNVTNLQPREERRMTIELRPDRLMPITSASTIAVTTAVGAVSRVAAPADQAPPITPEPVQELSAATTPPEAAAESWELILPVFDDEPGPLPEAGPQEPEPIFVVEPFDARPPKPAPAILPLTATDEADTAAPRLTPTHRTETTHSAAGVPIFFEMRTPTLAELDAAVAAIFEIRNPGRAPLTDLVIQVEMTNELDHERGRILEHRIARLAPGDVYRTRLTTRAVRDGLARVRSTLTSAEDLESTLEAEVKVSPIDTHLTQTAAARSRISPAVKSATCIYQSLTDN